MGSSISIDKQPTALDQILHSNPTLFPKTMHEFEPESHAHHLKIWRFQQEANCDQIKTHPMNLSEPQDFSSQDCYLVLLIYRPEEPQDVQGLPHSLWGMVESLSNLTPRGLQTVFATDDAACLDTFLLSKRLVASDNLHYMLFIWNGKRAGALLKAVVLTRGFELDTHLLKGKAPMLHVLFCGGTVRNKKIAKGQLLTLESAYKSDPNIQEKPKKPVYLLKWLWPETPAPSPPVRPLFPKFKEYFLSSPPSQPLFISYQEDTPVPQLQIEIKAKPVFSKQKPFLPSLPTQNLKNREQERMELEGLGIDDIEDNIDIRQTIRDMEKYEHFNELCSEAIPGIHVGSDFVARDFYTLKKNGITHIINCAANVCKNYFPQQFVYTHYFLKDARTESIECVFYQTCEFIHQALEQGGKVFVHCMQGISRSVTVVLSYMIWKMKLNFDDVFKIVHQSRGVAQPNFGFQVQLTWWYKRLYEDYENLTVSPRVFAIGSHQAEQPSKIVARLLMEAPFTGSRYPLDPRGVYIALNDSAAYIWIGNSVLPQNRDKYLQKARTHLQKLQLYQRAPDLVTTIQQGSEPSQFWHLWGLQEPPEYVSSENEANNHWYVDLEQAVDQEPESLKADQSPQEEEERGKKPKLFVYPDTDGFGVFDQDDLGEEVLVVLCASEKCYVRVGELCYQPQQIIEQYVDMVCKQYYGGKPEIIYEATHSESDEFMDYFMQGCK